MTDRDETRRRIGLRIAEIRAARKISQTQLAGLTGIKQGNISRIELGRYSVGLDTLETIARALGCTVDFVEAGE
ncbi:helix-turn-helix domain-containing protein [Prevotella sp. KH2C16]|uniref:helix-turn-helix domain-containing protein n=1 Tax=Prevotella sp. KH2C16 TaxID=1855325 RepID=UPI0008E900C0|nr:helix-turn-helix transcriptional regulator [Prevotella sp. KH2C16]SFG38289.1 DNA-binding transcriptional regulator, XRE family [Prevotella sp. KH2C16]SFG75458.1 DNA-binding transcriptional regulator, XRE family [Prevotella sp. KH2C16]